MSETSTPDPATSNISTTTGTSTDSSGTLGNTPIPGSGGSTGEKPGATSGGTDDSTEGKMLPQDEVNAIVAREVAKAQRGKLDPKELGFESAKELKDFMDQAKQSMEAAKDESTKEFEAAVKEAREQARTEILAVANDRLIRAEFMLAAVNKGVRFGDDAYALAKTMEGWSSVEVSDEGKVSGLDDAFFEELKTQKPYLFEEPKTAIPDAGAGAHGAPGEKNSPQELAAKYPALRGRVPQQP